MKGQNARISKIHNRSIVFRLIHQHPDISRKELADLTGLTKASISGIIDSMMNAGLVTETARNKKEKNLVLVPQTAAVLAVYIGKVKITAAVIDLSGHIVLQDTLYEEVDRADLKIFPKRVSELVVSLMNSSSVSAQRILAVGIAAPGAFERKRSGDSAVEGKRPFVWKAIGLVEKIERETGLPVFIENRSSLAALGEQWFGAGRNYRTFVQYSIGLGIGGGAVVEDRLYRGNNNVVCEIGHTTVDYHGEICFCGNRGCLDTIGSMKNLVNGYRDLAGLRPYDLDTMGNGSIVAELKEIFRRAKECDPNAKRAIREHAEILGIGAVSLVNIFNPECIIISSNDIGDIDLSDLVKGIESYVRNRAYSVSAWDVQIRRSSLGENIHLKGIFAMIMEIFAQNSFKPL